MKINKRYIFNVFYFLILFFMYSSNVQSRMELDHQIIQDSITQRKDLEVLVKKQKEEIKELEKSFTYLDDLSEEERTRYKTFYETKNSNDLSLSPEKTLLVYLHAASNDDIEVLHALTHNSQSLEEFADDYRTNGKQTEDLESVITFRYYDYVKILEGGNQSTDALVELSVSQSHTQRANIFSLKKTSDSWKLDFTSTEP